MKELICIVCPKGCHLKVDEDMNVSGYSCEKGIDYAKKELTSPTRTVTSSIRIKGGLHKKLPVKSNGELPRKLVFDTVKFLHDIEVVSPIKMGDIIAKDIFSTGIDIIATRNM